MWYLGRGEYAVLTCLWLITPTPKMTTTCHLISMKCQSAVKKKQRERKNRKKRRSERRERERKKNKKKKTTWRLGELTTCAKGATTLQTPLQKKGADTHKPAFRVAKTVVACSSLAKQAARWAAEAHVLLRFRGWSGCATFTGTAPASETQAKEGEGDCFAGCRSGFRLAFSHFSLTFLARLSPRPSHIQRAQLAIGTRFRCGRPSFGQRHHFLRQVWSRLLGGCGRSLPPMQRIPRWQNVTATQIEVGALPEQTLPWLDSRARSSAHSGRSCHSGGAAGILRGLFGSYGHGAHHTQKATSGPPGSGACTLGNCRRGC